MSTVAPTIPPRPTRAQEAAAAQGVEQLPEIPPRPINKRLDRSVSPGHYPRSPLNEPYSPLAKTISIDATAHEGLIPRRPSVQHLPSVGQEGMEYAEIQYKPIEPVSSLGADAAAQTRNVAEDLHLHAPKPSLPKASATAQVQAVTRTDASGAAAHGLGKPPTPAQEDLSHDTMGRVRSRASFSRPESSNSLGRRQSNAYAEDHGPAEIGMRVPINPLLGDVQAPSPAPFSPNHTGQNGETKRRHHFRTKSGRDVAPPGSYGLHGHGVATTDPFEKDWYVKHPEEAQHEEAHGHGVYAGVGSGRGAFALSSDDLNKIVRNTASRGSGFGTSGNTVSYPDEQIGYLASEQYTSQPATPLGLTKTLTNQSQPAIESPLRKASMPGDDVDPVSVSRSKRPGSQYSGDASEDEHGPVHINEPKRQFNKITGGQETIDETQDLRAYLRDEDEHDYSVPILAADEVAKGGDSEHLHPAVSPRYDRRSSSYDYEQRSGDNTPSQSRPSSRPGSIYGLHSASHSLSRFISHHDDRDAMHTPLEDVDEYEPLFPDDDSKHKALSHAERFKRPDALKHRFPSQDIWEDTPDSAYYQATVSTPDLPQEIKATAAFEPPEAEAVGKGEKLPARADDFLSRSKPHMKQEMSRPSLQHRFPSQDIWEDSPESYHLSTTVSNPPAEDVPPPDFLTKPMVPPRPVGKSKLSETAVSSQLPPSIPPRPQKTAQRVPPIDSSVPGQTSPTKHRSPTDLRKVPSIPDRPKPQVPPRPAKKTSGEALAKTLSKDSADSNETEKAISVTSPPMNKSKPQVPARPGQNKFANLKGNFMNDLSQRIGAGPPKVVEKDQEPELEAKPLEDARKGRARGPQRRAPAKSPVAAPAVPAMAFSMSKPQSLWHIDDSNSLNVGTVQDLQISDSSKALEEETPVTLSSEKIEQLDHATIADAPLPPSVDTANKAAFEENSGPEDAPSIATNAAEEFPDPTMGTPTMEKSNPLSLHPTAEGVDLSQNSTQSSEGLAHHMLEREVPDPSTDAIPASQQTTASAHDGHPLELQETKAPEEPIRIRDEQVSAPAPGAGAAMIGERSGSKVEEAEIEDAKRGADTPKEPMPEQDVSYAKLEEMQSKADGKELSDGGMKKIVD